MKKGFLLLVALLLLAGCSPKSNQDNGKLNVTVTTTMVADLVAQIGKDHVIVSAMMLAGVDPHLYKAKPSDLGLIQNADVIVFNGVHLEARMDDVLSALRQPTIKLEDGIDSDDFIVNEEQGGLDPHIWFSTKIWKQAATYVGEMLGEYDPENKYDYLANAAAYNLELDQLTSYIESRLLEVNEEQRVLVTAHDAFTYFSKEFNIEVKAIQGISTESEAGIADINDVANMIVKRKIKAIYTESSVPAKTIESLQAAIVDKGFDVVIGGELYSDSLKENATYIETFKANVDTIVESLKSGE